MKVIGPLKVNNEKLWTVQVWKDGKCRTTVHSSKKEAIEYIRNIQ